MKIAAQFIGKFTRFITSSLSCFDRVIFKGHLRPLSYAQGLESFVDYTLGIRRKDFMAWAKRQSQRIFDHARHLAEQANCPFVYLQRRIRKEQLVQQFLRSHPIDQGLVCVLRCLEHCPSFRLTVGDGRPRFTPAKPKALVFYFYYLDPDLGLIHIRVPTLFLVGEHEVIYPAADAVQRLADAAPQIEAAIIPDAGHDLLIVQARLVNEKVLEFLTRPQADRSTP